jgi:hypothetical protein
VFEALLYALGDLDDRAQAAILGGNAVRFYRLDNHPQSAP